MIQQSQKRTQFELDSSPIPTHKAWLGCVYQRSNGYGYTIDCIGDTEEEFGKKMLRKLVGHWEEI